MEPIKIVLKTEYRTEGIIYLSDGSQFEINSGMYKDAVNHNFTFTVAPGYETSYYVMVRENSFTWPRHAFVIADAPELKTSTKDSHLPHFVKGDKVVLKEDYRKEGYYNISGSQNRVYLDSNMINLMHNHMFLTVKEVKTSFSLNNLIIIEEDLHGYTWPSEWLTYYQSLDFPTTTLAYQETSIDSTTKSDLSLSPPLYKSGDKVQMKVFSELGIKGVSDCIISSCMAKFSGRIVTIKRVSQGYIYNGKHSYYFENQKDMQTTYPFPEDAIAHLVIEPDPKDALPIGSRKFKVGDKVVIKKELNASKDWFDSSRNTNRLNKNSKERLINISYLTISYVFQTSPSYYVNESPATLAEDWLEFYKEEPSKSKIKHKYKIGDVVQLQKEYIKNPSKYNPYLLSVVPVSQRLNNRLVIKDVLCFKNPSEPSLQSHDLWYRIEDDAESWNWNETWLEPYKEEKEMSKSDNYKFKEGDRVIVKPANRIEGKQSNGVQINDDMLRHINGHMCLTIANSDYKESTGKFYHIEEDGGNWIWCEEWLDFYEEEKLIKTSKAKKIIKEIVNIVKGEPEPKVDEYGFYVGQKVKLKSEFLKDSSSSLNWHLVPRLTSNMIDIYKQKGYVTIAEEYNGGYRVMEDHLTHAWHHYILEPYTVASIDKNQKLPIQTEDEKKFILKPIKSLTIITEE